LIIGLAKAQYAVGYFTEMGIGCRRDPLEANVWYVKAADQGDERAKHRIAAIRAAADGANPAHAARSGGRLRKGDVKGQGEHCMNLASEFSKLTLNQQQINPNKSASLFSKFATSTISIPSRLT
jgi:TPR repeat protein